MVTLASRLDRPGSAAELPNYLATGTIVGLCALLGLVGADARWLSAMGHFIVAHGIPHGIPFATAPTVHWHDVTALAQVLFWALEAAAGDRGLMLAQLAAVAIACGVLVRDARAGGARPRGTAFALLLAALGAAPALAVARAQLFSVALFPLLMMLLRGEARAPSRRIWLLIPLVALWANLHGGVLIGVLAAALYLLVARFHERPLEVAGLLPLLGLALFANPAGTHAFAYYHGVLSNQAASQGEGMWGAISLTSPFDLLLVLSAVTLAVRAWRTGPALWERGLILLLAVLTVGAARSGVWLLFTLVPPAALAPRRAPHAPSARLVALGAGVALAAAAVGLIRGPVPSGATEPMLVRAIGLAGATPILASDVPAEQVALAGGRVWASDPIDAFQPRTQLTYLRWLDGSPTALRAIENSVRVALVSRSDPADRLMARAATFRLVARDARTDLFVRALR